MGTAFVVGRNLVPRPAAGTIAVRNAGDVLVGLLMSASLSGNPRVDP